MAGVAVALLPVLRPSLQSVVLSGTHNELGAPRNGPAECSAEVLIRVPVIVHVADGLRVVELDDDVADGCGLRYLLTKGKEKRVNSKCSLFHSI